MKSAILFLVFNRPDTTTQVFGAIRQAKPPRLYVAGDGPREGREGEAERVAKVREIATSVDWPCQVKTLFRSKNFGCKYAVSEAISWFFAHEKEGIILEDDCLPHSSFFSFCEVMLDSYRCNKSVWMISGFNPRHPGETSSAHFLSKVPSVWGWASWRDRWEKYDAEMSDFSSKKDVMMYPKLPKYVKRYYQQAFENAYRGAVDTWDHQLTWTILSRNGYAAKPYANLVSNIGVVGAHASTKDLNHFVGLGKFCPSRELQLDSHIGFDEDLWFYKTRLKKTAFSYVYRAAKKIWRTLT